MADKYVHGHGLLISEVTAEKFSLDAYFTVPDNTRIIFYSRAYTSLHASYVLDVLRLNARFRVFALDQRMKRISQEFNRKAQKRLTASAVEVAELEPVIASEGMLIMNHTLSATKGETFEQVVEWGGKSLFADNFLTPPDLIEAGVTEHTGKSGKKYVFLSEVIQALSGHDIHFLACRRRTGGGQSYAPLYARDLRLDDAYEALSQEVEKLPTRDAYSTIRQALTRLEKYRFFSKKSLYYFSEQKFNDKHQMSTELRKIVDTMHDEAKGLLARIREEHPQLSQGQQAVVNALSSIMLIAGQVGAAFPRELKSL